MSDQRTLSENEWSLFGELVEAFRDGTAELEKVQAENTRLRRELAAAYYDHVGTDPNAIDDHEDDCWAWSARRALEGSEK